MTQAGTPASIKCALLEEVQCAESHVRPRAGDLKVLIVLAEWHPWECGADRSRDS